MVFAPKAKAHIFFTTFVNVSLKYVRLFLSPVFYFTESETPLYTDFVLKSQQQQQQQQQAGNNSPYECLYIPYVGLVRCLPR